MLLTSLKDGRVLRWYVVCLSKKKLFNPGVLACVECFGPSVAVLCAGGVVLFFSEIQIFFYIKSETPKLQPTDVQ